MAEPIVEPIVEAIKNETNATAIPIEGSMLAYASLYSMALVCIAIGSCRSVAFVKEHLSLKKKIENSISWKEARMFPITASAVLFTLYIFFKYNDLIQEYMHTGINMALKRVKPEWVLPANTTANATSSGILPKLSKEHITYGLLMLLCYEGSFALAKLLKPLFSNILYRIPTSNEKIRDNIPYQLLFTHPVHKGSHERTELVNVEFDTHDLVSFACCALVGIAHVYYRHWITNNIIGMAFCIYGIEALHLSSFKGGVLLLAGLFVYDVFWVFATDVMATVATSIQAPILLLFPQDLLINGTGAKKFAMLGLGDIVIPGIFLALLRRFGHDFSSCSETNTAPKNEKNESSYYCLTFCAYGAGLVLTILVMHWFKAAQPALLYLVPMCVGAPSLVAAAKGEFAALLAYSEEQLVHKDEDKEKKKEE